MKPPAFPVAWNIVSAQLMADTPASFVWEVRRADGSRAVVKDMKPAGLENEKTGARFLQWRNGRDAVRLLGWENQAHLLEYAGDRTLLDELNEKGDEAASELAIEMLVRLGDDSALDTPQGLTPLDEHFRSLFTRADHDRQNGRETLFTDAADCARKLIANQRDLRPLHGDFHHENMLHGPRGWLLIDPAGVYGDACYDAANLFYNPLDRDDLRGDPARAERLARQLARRLGREESDFLLYGFVHACLSASWHLGDDNRQEAERSLNVARAVHAAL
ncbi:aminoglycoside/hydroxyurea antibiotic resistance kinase [Nitratireductor indicus C115]|uniref:Aminoglycoside/hydroxyurea antibiotic resistance kinase n=1 Tax=Nitratireductor indicus C115 TaxID=1231190 RepID=K2PP07_9HYPH|nr:aminoglycoside phosphotransferase family protein [Nitratireductor indicus]EKF42802.1 aminoglycoside/hydroxyurea antibiotic resistance kinase [Nitratireductor indicus C115]SFQ40460.1 streptomycin 6-kinase [Nitratireductor indicus]